MPVTSADKATWCLKQWLAHLETVHPNAIDLGLARTQTVFTKLDLDLSHKTVITVAGTNGKGSTCAMLEQAALALGKGVGVFSSPHIHDYRERLRINGKLLSEQDHCGALFQVEQARGDTQLTYFEFSTLSCLMLLAESDAQWLILEVGLGGRLDATNVVDANVAVITSIDLDHQTWLGDTREQIGTEKAGILRAGIPAVIGDPQPPATIVNRVNQLGCLAQYQGRDFHYRADGQQWHWQHTHKELNELPLPNLPMQNISTALAVLPLLGVTLNEDWIAPVIARAALPGRFETLCRRPLVVADVAHNPQACRYLTEKIAQQTYRELHLICAMLEDKDIAGSLAPLQQLEASWTVCTIDTPRAASAEQLKSVLDKQQKVVRLTSVEQALAEVLAQAHCDDLVVVFGSFYTVAEAQRYFFPKE